MATDILTTKVFDAIIRPEKTVFVSLTNIDEFNRIFEETKDKVDEAVDKVDEAVNEAETAVNNANSAVTRANTAVANANIAVTRAETAVTGAAGAKTIADKALSKTTELEKNKVTSRTDMSDDEYYIYTREYGEDTLGMVVSADEFAEKGLGTNRHPRYSDGRLATKKPATKYHCVNKGYLDEKVDELNQAIRNYVDDKFNGADKAVSFEDYSSMINELNASPNTGYSVSQNIMIVTSEVPDLWVSSIEETRVPYEYTSDGKFVNDLIAKKSVQVGYFKLSALETQKVDLTKYAEKDYVNTQVDKKVNSVTGAGPYVYCRYNGEDKVYQVYPGDTYAGNANGIPRYVGSRLFVKRPQETFHVANKAYVDDEIKKYMGNSSGTEGTKLYLHSRTIRYTCNNGWDDFESSFNIKITCVSNITTNLIDMDNARIRTGIDDWDVYDRRLILQPLISEDWGTSMAEIPLDSGVGRFQNNGYNFADIWRGMLISIEDNGSEIISESIGEEYIIDLIEV